MSDRLLLLGLLFLITCPVAWAQDPVGEEFQANSYTTLSQAWPAAAMDAIVVWTSVGQDGSGH